MSTIYGSVTYTPVGRALAQAGSSSYGGKTWESAREIMRDSFQSIASSSSTSPSEKAIADLGLRVGSHTMPNNDAASARYAVMQSIVGGVSGAIGAVLAHATIDAYASKQWESARAITKDGFDTILQYSPDNNDRAVAKLGIEFGSHTMRNDDAASARLEALRTISKGSQGDVAQVLARTTVAAYGNKQWDAARAITMDGLEAIANNPDTSADQKAMARLGIAFGSHTMPNNDSATARLTVLRELSQPLSGSLTDEICNASISAYGEKQWNSARAILKDGFEAVLSNPNATQAERELAKLGLEVGANNMTDQNAATARLSVMRQLRDL